MVTVPETNPETVVETLPETAPETSRESASGLPEGLARSLHGIFEELAREHRVTGAQIALYHAGTLHAHSYGTESVRTGRPVTQQTAFPFGSVTKFFTAALVMQLVSDGDIDLDEPLADLLPELRTPGGSGTGLGAATVRQLLSHTAGLPDSIEYADMRGPSYRRFAAACAQAPALHAPGLAFSYSNTGYCLLGAVVEAVAGMDWWTAMDSCLLRPLGIEPAFLHDPRPGSAPAARSIADGHAVRADSDNAEIVDHMTDLSLAAAGGLVGSAVDLVTAARLHLDDRTRFAHEHLLPEDAVRLMHEPVPVAEPFGLADAWGLGLMSHRSAGGVWFGHDGAVGGASCNMRLHPAGNTALALTANSTAGPRLWEALVTELRAAGLDLGHYRLPEPDAPQITEPDAYLGTYANGDLHLVVMPGPDGGLYLTRADYADYRLTIHTDDRFVARDNEHDGLPIVGRFVRERSGGPIVLLQYGGRALQRL
ncbi:serine hydrolase domain-containing protein [Streptomyces sp. NPDC002476]|uniref:serine hydrolase domain-containing protein n=1 Tax=Streptomyces sp. NPDC002476 TaxID=3364648 RepID=UPI0036B3A279